MISRAWTPLRHTAFRALWIAALASQVGTWMETVGAQWILVQHPHAATTTALIQTATTLPVLFLALPGGALADVLDRRRLLIAVQSAQAALAATIAVLALLDRLGPAELLALTFGLGCGAALTVAPYQAMIPELVPRPDLPSASALGSLSVNLARAVGPAAAGLLVARLGPAAVFALNALSFAAFAVVMTTLRGRAPAETRPEAFLAAVRAGERYVRFSPEMRRILLRIALFITPAVALWALLPVVAAHRLGLGPTGYGLLLAAVGAGSIAGAFLLPWLRGRLSPNRAYALCAAVYAAGLAVLALTRSPVLSGAALVPAGAAWIVVLSNSNAAVQLFLPGWVRARGLSAYQFVFSGSQAVAAAAWGVAADRFGITIPMLLSGVLLLLALISGRWWPYLDTVPLDRGTPVHWPEPHLLIEPEEAEGPVVVLLRYCVPPERHPAFVAAMQRVRDARLRTGALQWGVFRAGEEPGTIVEIYTVSSWEEHRRQHDERLTAADYDDERRARAFADGEPEVTHLFSGAPSVSGSP
ncbi:MFS transporter [Dactylosporangium matsuzakiense]|uniref:MFS transporter n=1 Tax=Dactylosporangium matsuzakiense TaxID=53360 RepID=UPI0021C459FB|nr:MFS transporter [Dactylosporangium matsuzakiense]UWZ47078.1 MFS transporter [Dactylosporangium matsuzakiense]